MNKYILVFVGILSACGSTKDDGVVAVTNGLEGTYLLNRVECFDASLNTTATATSGPATYQNTLEIAATTMKSYERQGSCTSTESASVTFTPSATQVSSSYTVGTAKITSRSVANSTGGSCTFVTSINNNTGRTISPAASSQTVAHGATLGPVEGTYIVNKTNNSVAFVSGAFTTSVATDTCVFIYLKQ